MFNFFKELFSEKRKTKLSGEIATRERAYGFYSWVNGVVSEYDNVMSRLGLATDDLRQLLSDAHVWACVQSRKAGVLSLEWEIARGKAKSRETKIIDQALRELDMHSVMSQMLDAFLWGYAPMELVWENRGGLVLPKDVVGKPPEWFRYGTGGGKGSETALRFLSTAAPLYGEEVPPGKFVVPRHHATYFNPYGEKVLSRIWWPVTWKKAGWKFWAIKAEKYGMPTLIGTAPSGSNQQVIDQLLDKLSQAVQDSAIAFTEGTKVEVLQSSGTGGTESYPDLIREANADISKAILGHSAVADATPGKLGNETMASDIRWDIVDGDRRMVERAMNELIGWVHRFNFASGEPPEFVMFEKEQVDKTLAERDAILVQAMQPSKVTLSREYWMEAFGFEEHHLVDRAPEPQADPFGPSPQGVRPPNQTTLPPDEEQEEAAKQAGEIEEAGLEDEEKPEFAEAAPKDAADHLADQAELQSGADFELMVRAAYEQAMQSDSPGELRERMASAYPGISVDAIAEVLARGGFASAAAGFAEAEQKAGRVAKLRAPAKR